MYLEKPNGGKTGATTEVLYYYAIIIPEYKSMIDRSVKSCRETDKKDLVRQTSLLHGNPTLINTQD